MLFLRFLNAETNKITVFRFFLNRLSVNNKKNKNLKMENVFYFCGQKIN